MSSAAASSTVFNSQDQQHHHHLLSPTDQLCYVHCNFCDTVLAVSVPCSSLFKTVTVRCGHCSNLISVNMRALLLPPANNNNQLHLPHPFFSTPHNLLQEDIRNTPSNTMMNHQPCYTNESIMPIRGQGFDHLQDIPKPPAVVNRPPEKRQRVPSAYNRFIKEEIQRIKAGNPDINHREAFSAAAKNWAHFPHIHFGLMPDQPVKKTSMRHQEGDDMLVKDGFFSTPANMGVSPY